MSRVLYGVPNGIKINITGFADDGYGQHQPRCPVCTIRFSFVTPANGMRRAGPAGSSLRHDEMHPKLRRSDAGRPSPAALARPCRARAPAPPAGGDPFPGTAGRRRLVAAPGRETGERSPLAGECPRHGVRRPAAALASAHPHASTGASVAGTSQSGGRAAALHMNASVVGSCKGPPSSPRPSARLQTLPHRPAPATIDGGRDAPICRTLGASPAREENHGLWGVYSRARALAFA